MSWQPEAELSWSVDFAARRDTARDEAAPHRRTAKAAGDAAAERLPAAQAEAERLAREASTKAQGIEDAIDDLKAVNPREVKAVDTRTPAQLLEAIAAQGRAVDAALASPKAQLAG